MYIDFAPNRGSRPATLLRESIREGKRIKKRTIANLSAALKSGAIATLVNAGRLQRDLFDELAGLKPCALGLRRRPMRLTPVHAGCGG
jgi:hypothetical protein